MEPRSFLQKTRFLDILAFFWLDFDRMSFNLVKYASVTRQLAALPTSIAFYDILARACAEILGFSIFEFFFSAFLFSRFLFFSLQWLTFYWACLWLKNFYKSVIETDKFYDGTARCSGRKFCARFFTQLFEHFCAYLGFHWANHLDLGIIGKMFSSCPSWV